MLRGKRPFPPIFFRRSGKFKEILVAVVLSPADAGDFDSVYIRQYLKKLRS